METFEFYNRFQPFYSIVDAVLSGHKKELILAVNAYPNSKLLEVGVGTGSYLKHYKKQQVTAIDSSIKMLEVARKNNTAEINFSLLQANQLKELNAFFDTIVFSHVLSTSKNSNQIVSAALNCLKPKGRLIILNHFSNNKTLSKLEKLFQPIASLFHFQSYFPLENLTTLLPLKQVKASKFGLLNAYQLLIFEKPE